MVENMSESVVIGFKLIRFFSCVTKIFHFEVDFRNISYN